MLKNDTKWEWSVECENAFTAIKHHLVSAPVLAYPDTNNEFILTTDSSGQGLGYILSQKDVTEKERVISYGGRALINSERNYPITELEGWPLLKVLRLITRIWRTAI